MPVFYRYDFAILGSDSSQGVGGGAFNYRFAPSGTWSYSGTATPFIVEENDGATQFNGDSTNETISEQERFDGTFPQLIDIDGTLRQSIWDYTFEVSLGGQTWRIGVIDVDLNDNNTIQAGAENGYFLVFPDGLPPADTDLSVGSIVENDATTSHAGLGAQVVCFVNGTLIETSQGPQPVEALKPGDLILTRDGGLQPLRWLGRTFASARGGLAPIVIGRGVLGNSRDLIVSPQHAVLLEDWRAELLYGQPDVLVSAQDLLGQAGVSRREGGVVTYCHLLFDAHHLVKAAGIWSESLYPGDVTRETVGARARREIETLVPDLNAYGPKRARCLRRFEAECLAA